MSILDELTVRAVCEAVSVYSERGRVLDIRDRFAYGLSFCQSGEILYTHKGRRILSTPSVAVLLPKGESYHLNGSKAGVFPLINFYTETEDIHDFHVFPVYHLESYLRDFEEMRELMLRGRDRLRVLSLFYGMLARLSAEAAGERDTLAPILDYLEANYGNPSLSNTVLAEQGSISEVYMRQLFRERLHTSPKQYIITLRMQRAKQLLTQSDATVGEIAAACGFSAIYHFSAVFNSFTGMTPTAYRRQNRRVEL